MLQTLPTPARRIRKHLVVAFALTAWSALSAVLSIGLG